MRNDDRGINPLVGRFRVFTLGRAQILVRYTAAVRRYDTNDRRVIYDRVVVITARYKNIIIIITRTTHTRAIIVVLLLLLLLLYYNVTIRLYTHTHTHTYVRVICVLWRVMWRR